MLWPLGSGTPITTSTPSPNKAPCTGGTARASTATNALHSPPDSEKPLPLPMSQNPLHSVPRCSPEGKNPGWYSPSAASAARRPPVCSGPPSLTEVCALGLRHPLRHPTSLLCLPPVFPSKSASTRSPPSHQTEERPGSLSPFPGPPTAKRGCRLGCPESQDLALEVLDQSEQTLLP